MAFCKQVARSRSLAISFSCSSAKSMHTSAFFFFSPFSNSCNTLLSFSSNRDEKSPGNVLRVNRFHTHNTMKRTMLFKHSARTVVPLFSTHRNKHP